MAHPHDRLNQDRPFFDAVFPLVAKGKRTIRSDERCPFDDTYRVLNDVIPQVARSEVRHGYMEIAGEDQRRVIGALAADHDQKQRQVEAERSRGIVDLNDRRRWHSVGEDNRREWVPKTQRTDPLDRLAAGEGRHPCEQCRVDAFGAGGTAFCAVFKIDRTNHILLVAGDGVCLGGDRSQDAIGFLPRQGRKGIFAP